MPLNPARTLAVVAMVLLVGVGTARAQQQDGAFRQGLEARDAKNWTEMAAQMQRAIDADKNESTRKVGERLGIFGGMEYLPYFFLGEALYNKTDCAGALRAWDESRRQGVVLKEADKLRTMNAGSTKCESAGFLPVARLTKEVADARASYEAAVDVGNRFNEYNAEHPEALRSDARTRSEAARAQLQTAYDKLTSGANNRRSQDLSESKKSSDEAARAYRALRDEMGVVVEAALTSQRRLRAVETTIQAVETDDRDLDTFVASAPVGITIPKAALAARVRARDLVANARTQLRPAGRTPVDADLAAAERTVQEARSSLTSARQQIDQEIKAASARELGSLQSAVAGDFTRIDTRAQAVEAAVASSRDPSATSKQLAAWRSRLATSRRRFDQAVRGGDLTAARGTINEQRDLASALEVIAGTVTLPRPAIPETLSRAAQAFLEARYQDVLTQLPQDAPETLEIPMRVQAHLFRAAAAFALFEYSGRSDMKLQQLARDEADACRRLDSSFRPAASAFGPRFIGFFEAGAGTTP